MSKQKTDDELAAKVTAAAVAADAVDEQTERITELETELAAAEDAKLRAVAEAQNIQKRRGIERAELPTLGKVQAIEALLPALDNLELALANQPEQLDDWGKGVAGTMQQLLDALTALDVERIDTVGVPADTACHEVIAVDDQQPKDEVCQVLQAGYRLGERVIRVAKVQVGSK